MKVLGYSRQSSSYNADFILHYHLNKPKKLVSKDSKDFFLSIELNYAHNKHNFVFQIIENSSQKHKFA